MRIGGVNLLDNGASQSAGVGTAIGPLGVTTAEILGFDIAANDNEAFAVLADAAPPNRLYKINLTTGAATFVRKINIFERIRGLALVSRAVTIYGLTSPTGSAPGGAIITALSAVPGTLLPMPSGAPVAITGLTTGESVVAIDTRPATGDLVGVTSTGRLLRINPVNGQTLFIAQVSVAFAGAVAGFDFHPNDDRLRITTDTGQNLSVVPDTGVATEETALNMPGTVGLAYAADGALYGIDDASDSFTVFADAIDRWRRAGARRWAPTPARSRRSTSRRRTAPASRRSPRLAARRRGCSPCRFPTAACLPVADIGGGAVIRGLAVARPGRVRFPVADLQRARKRRQRARSRWCARRVRPGRSPSS